MVGVDFASCAPGLLPLSDEKQTWGGPWPGKICGREDSRRSPLRIAAETGPHPTSGGR